jgi:uncharacterized protein (TIGR00725 family)
MQPTVPSDENRAVLKTYIAVIGSGEATEVEASLAGRVGVLLADAGAVVISGGLGGVMRASCEAAFHRGGTTVGLLPGSDRSAGNPFLTVALPTGLGELRNGLVVAVADAIIAVGGGWGTLNEIALAMRVGKPLVAMRSWNVESPPHQSVQPLTVAQSPEEAVRLVLAMVRSTRDLDG